METSESERNTDQVTVPKWVRDWAITAMRAAVLTTCGFAWGMFMDIRDLKAWRSETIPLQMEIQAKQLQSQISAGEDRSTMNRAAIQSLQMEIVMIQIQLARMEGQRNGTEGSRR